MNHEIIYIDRGDERQIEEEEQNNFIYNILSQVLDNTPEFEEVWFDEELDDITKKIKIKNILRKLNIEILKVGRGAEIYFENELVAVWYEPKYRKMMDLKQINPDKKIYLEMTLSYKSIFDEETNE